MGTVQLSDDQNVIDCTNNKMDNKKRFEKKKGKLRKAGFNPEDTSKDRLIKMNKENWALIAKQQLESQIVDLPEHTPAIGPLNSFEEAFQLERRVWAAMNHCELLVPTPIQRIAIPYIVQTDCDMIVQAQTGSGKTYSFLLPIIDYIIQAKSQKDSTPNSSSPYAVIIAPTRELTLQLACDAARLVKDLWCVKVAYGVGELDMRDSIRMLKEGCDMLFVTPGRLYDYFNREGHRASTLDTNNLKFVVCDEADRLVERNNHGRRSPTNALQPADQILKQFIVDRLTNEEHRNFRVLLFSATLQHHMFNEFVVHNNLITIKVGNETPVMTVRQSFVEVKHEHEKMENFMNLMEVLSANYNDLDQINRSLERPCLKMGKTIVFVNNKRLGDRMTHNLLDKGYQACSINADRTQRQRWEAMKNMLDGTLDVLVTTDVLSRGVNIARVDYVINYDFPQDFSSHEYVHRVGRCGRIGNSGDAITFFDPKKDYASAQALIDGCLAVRQDIPDFILECIRSQNRNHRSTNGQQHHSSLQKPISQHRLNSRGSSLSSSESNEWGVRVPVGFNVYA